MSDKIDINNFLDISIEEIFADRYSRYSKYIIQDRALPDARDGLKPVQRRILYSMFKEGNTFDKQFRKSAKTVGNVIGNYHPHGDTSVYDAMVRTSQSWKLNQLLVIMHGNNGSIDGDSPAAMRYTEAKLSKYSEFIISDINEDTVDMVPNFDDTELEPIVLPTKIPNLLVNGATGISAGYATDIPPHNITEVLKATLHLNNNPEASVEELLEFVKGPDFPTGAIVQGKDELIKAYKTGRGKVVLKAKYHFEKNAIIVTEIPYEINKQSLIQKIDLIRVDKKVDGIVEILDQSNKDILEIAINCKKDANLDVIVNYLLKNTDLQKNYNFNMIAINKRRPEEMGLKDLLKSFLNHRKEVVINRSQYRLTNAQNRVHIIEGLYKAVSVMDEIIVIIRKSKDKAESKNNLVKEFSFTPEQAEAIVMMQLYRLSNTDILKLEEQLTSLHEDIKELTKIISDANYLQEYINNELNEMLSKFNVERKTQVEDEVTKIEISTRDLIKSEPTIISITENGYIKRSNLRSYGASSKIIDCDSNDRVLKNILCNTRDNLLVFFNDGSFVNMYVNTIADVRWKDARKHISTYCKINDGVKVISAYTTKQFHDISEVVGISRKGYINKVEATQLDIKLNNKVIFQKVKDDDELVSVVVNEVDGLGIFNDNKILITTTKDRFLSLAFDDVDTGSLRRVGKRVYSFSKLELINFMTSYKESIVCFTDHGGYFRTKIEDKYLKPEKLFTNVKSKPHKLVTVVDERVSELIFKYENIEEIIEFKTLSKNNVGEKIRNLQKFDKIDCMENIIDINIKKGN